MKNLPLFLCLVFSFYSCNKQDKTKELPYKKVYIVESNWTMLFEKDYKTNFRVVGFSELDNNFNLRFAYRVGYDYNNYYSSNTSIADSLRDKILNTISKYPTDTTFLYSGRGLYESNPHILIFQKNNNDLIRIYFHPEFLPQDLQFLYDYLYKNKQTQVGKDEYNELFTKFENIFITGSNLLPPPPELKATIQFTPPVVKKKK